jgi:hypothetical protein
MTSLPNLLMNQILIRRRFEDARASGADRLVRHGRGSAGVDRPGVGVGMSGSLYVFAPIPRPGLWSFSSNPQPPPGHIVLAAAEMHRHRERRSGRTELVLSDSDPAARGDLARLMALFAQMPPAQRSQLIDFAQQQLDPGHSSG